MSSKRKSQAFKKGLLSNYLLQKRINAAIPFIKGDILDIGCGYSAVVERLPLSSYYIGLDENPAAIERMRKKFPARNFYVLDIETQRLPLGNRKFDTIVMLAIIEHLSNPAYILEQLPDFMKENANLVITSPTKPGDWVHRLGAKFHLFSQHAVEDHQYIYSKHNLNTLLNQFNFTTIHYKTFLLGLNQLWVAQSMTRGAF